METLPKDTKNDLTSIVRYNCLLDKNVTVCVCVRVCVSLIASLFKTEKLNEYSSCCLEKQTVV